jgi:hypothetical protein
MRLFPMILALGLAACDTAGPGFLGVPKRIDTVDGSSFTLRRRGDLVEAIRTSPESLPRFQNIAPRAGVAAQRWTGCRAVWVMGDPSMMWIGLSCDGRAAPKMSRRPQTFYCDLHEAGQNVQELVCAR